MGICCCGTRGEPTDRQSCESLGCHYSEDPKTKCGGEGPCAWLGALSEYLHNQSNEDPVILLASGGTFNALWDLRDVLLPTSALGRRMLELYGEHSTPAMRIIRTDPELLREALRLFLVAASFGRAMLREHDGRNADGGGRRFTRQAYESGVAFLRQFKQAAGSDEFDEPIEFAERAFGQFVGRSPVESLALLQAQG